MKRMMSCLILLSLLMTCMISLSSCGYTEWFPTEGAWYCDELQMQLDCKHEETFVMIEGTKVVCAWGADRGSKVLRVGCQDSTTKYYNVGEWILTAEQVDLTETQLVVKSTDGVYYIFERVQ